MIASKDFTASCVRLKDWSSTENSVYGIALTLICMLLMLLYTCPPLWSSGQSSCLQIQRSGFDSMLYRIFWEVVGLERGPLSIVITIEELLERKNSNSNQEYGRKDPLCLPHNTLYPQKLALTSPTSGGRSVGKVRLRTKATELLVMLLYT
jgi:hypothetical protein